MMSFSVIIPVYNVAPYLRACLDSVIAAVREVEEREEVEKVGGGGVPDGKQPVVEIICVDDGSTDGSGVILDEYLEEVERKDGFGVRKEVEKVGGQWKDRLSSDSATSAVHLHLFSSPLFRIIHQPNAGVSAARNAALAVATGEWILFVDADDLISPASFCESVRIVLRYPHVDIVRFGTRTFNDGECVEWPDHSPKEYEIDVSKVVPYSEVAAALWGGVYRREIFPALGFKPYCRGEDRLFVGECVLKARSVVRSSMVAYSYRRRSGSAMCSRMNAKKLVDRLGYSHDWLLALTNTPKTVSVAIFHEIGVNITEGFVFDLYRLENNVAREDMWRLWYANLDWMREIGKFPVWTKFVIAVCNTFRIRVVALMLCWVPQRLKRLGIHR